MNIAASIHFGPFELRPTQRELWKRNERCRLGGRAFDILLALLENRHRVVSRNELLERVWPALAIEPNNLQVQICALRKVLGSHAIVTVARRGYRYAGPPPRATVRGLALQMPQEPAVATAGRVPAEPASRSRLRWRSRESA